MYVNMELDPKHTEILQIQQMKSEEYLSHTVTGLGFSSNIPEIRKTKPVQGLNRIRDWN